MKLVTTILKKSSTILAVLSFGFTLILAIMYGCDIIGRLILGKQITGTFEIAQFLLCLITFLAFPVSQITRSHIHVSFIINKFPQKLKHAIAAIGFLICSVMGCVMVYAFILQGNMALGKKMTTVLALPFAPMYYMAAFMMFCFVITFLVDTIRSVIALAGNDDAVAQVNEVFHN